METERLPRNVKTFCRRVKLRACAGNMILDRKDSLQSILQFSLRQEQRNIFHNNI